jgi:GT2 family glycosyltransferase
LYVSELSVSVVSYRTPTLLERCLQVLERERSSVDLDVTVVDNASGDGSADLVAAQFPWVRLIRSSRNMGFGAAHNQVLRRLNSPYALVLNSDAAPLPGALRTLVDFLDAHPPVAVAGPKLLFPNGAVQPSRRRFPTVSTLFMESTQVQRISPRNRVLDRYYMVDCIDNNQPSSVDWLVGACLCVRAEAIRQVGLFDERFFMYSEEMDWCRRFREAGWLVAYVPAAEVSHLQGGSTRLDLSARDRQFQASKLRYAAKWHGRRVAAALRLYLVLEYLVRAVEESLKLSLGSRVPERQARLRVIRSGLRHALRE